MFTAAQFKERLNENPFRPFRIHTSDGKTFDITNHDGAIVKRYGLEIGLDPDTDSISGRFITCAMIHSSRVEDMQTTAA